MLLDWFDLQNSSALLIYLVISFLIYGRPLVGNFSTTFLGAGADPTIFLWAIAWWPHAIASGINPFITRAIWAPHGANLAWVTSIPGPSLVMSPVTALFGPIVSYNLLNILCPLANAFSMYLLCRYVTKRFWPALLGGLIFAFSQYTVSQSTAHLFLLFIFPAPLAVLLVLRRLKLDLDRRVFIACLTVVMAIEFLCSTELFATTSMFGAFALALAYLFGASDTKSAIEKVVVELATTYGILIVVLAPYLYFVFARGVPPPINPGSAYSNDLFALLIPTQFLWVGGHSFDSLTARMHGWGEMSGYLGPGLMVVVALFIVSKRHEAVGKILTLMLVVLAVLSLGPVLHVLGVVISPMPWWLLSKLPLINQALPGRFGMYIYLVAALMASIFFSETRYSRWIALSLTVLCVLFLIPNFSRLLVTSASDQPAFCKSGDYKHYLAPGENVLFLPHGSESMSLLWQAESGFYYKIATGRVGMTPPKSAGWPILQSFDSNRAILDSSEQLKAFLGANHVTSIVLDEQKKHSWPALLAELGLIPIETGGVLLYRVPAQILNTYSEASPRKMAKAEALVNFELLIAAADRYLAERHPLAELTPWSAQQMGAIALPETINAEDAENHWWQNLWLGPAGKSLVGIGILGKYEDLQPITQKYGRLADLMLFPYPARLSNPRPTETGQLFRPSFRPLRSLAEAMRIPLTKIIIPHAEPKAKPTLLPSAVQ